jgi:phospholipase D-like protein/putative oligomerization/nucleic acid binding protein
LVCGILAASGFAVRLLCGAALRGNYLSRTRMIPKQGAFSGRRLAFRRRPPDKQRALRQSARVSKETGMEQEVVETGSHLGGITFGTFLLDALFIFFFVVWFWILIRVLMDLFRRRDISGLSKVLWVIFLVVLPYIGIFAYLLTQGWSMGERDVQQAEAAREQLRSVVGFSVADELTKLDQLKAAGSITEDEYKKLRAKLI